MALFQWISECDFQNYQSILKLDIVVMLNQQLDSPFAYLKFTWNLNWCCWFSRFLYYVPVSVLWSKLHGHFPIFEELKLCICPLCNLICKIYIFNTCTHTYFMCWTAYIHLHKNSKITKQKCFMKVGYLYSMLCLSQIKVTEFCCWKHHLSETEILLEENINSKSII